MHLFLFEPAEPRPLDERIRLARNEIANDPDCVWLDAPRGLIAAETERQGKAWAETYLVAPLRCT